MARVRVAIDTREGIQVSGEMEATQLEVFLTDPQASTSGGWLQIYNHRIAWADTKNIYQSDGDGEHYELMACHVIGMTVSELTTEGHGRKPRR